MKITFVKKQLIKLKAFGDVEFSFCFDHTLSEVILSCRLCLVEFLMLPYCCRRK